MSWWKRTIRRVFGLVLVWFFWFVFWFGRLCGSVKRDSRFSYDKKDRRVSVVFLFLSFLTGIEGG